MLENNKTPVDHYLAQDTSSIPSQRLRIAVVNRH
jgi:hypothetical protein